MNHRKLIGTIRTHFKNRLAANKLRSADSIDAILREHDNAVSDAAFDMLDGTAPAAVGKAPGVIGKAKGQKRHRRTNAEVAAEKVKLAAEKAAKKDAKAAKSAPAKGESDEQKALREEYEKSPLPAQPTRGKGKVTQSPEAAVAVAADKDAEFATTAPF